MPSLTRVSSAMTLALLFPVVSCGNDRDVDDPEADPSALEAGEPEPAEAALDTVQETVRSADGTRIGFTRVGDGPVPVVIVHGALTTSDSWLPVATAMAEHCTCYVMDRWARGASEARTEYSLEREIEDIVAVLEAAGPDALLLGHSSGAIYALEAALSAPVAGLILYEPPLHGWEESEPIHERIQSAAEEERYDEALSIFFVEILELPEAELSQLRTTPAWDAMVDLVPQSVREWEALRHDILDVDGYRDISEPTLLLEGTETADHHSSSTEALQRTLPDARTVMLDNQGHDANLTAPDLVAREVEAFLLGSEGAR